MLQLKLEPVQRAEYLSMHLLHHRGISRKAFGIEMLHLPGQLCDVLRGLWIVLYPLPKPTQVAHSLLIIAFYIGRIAGNIGGRRLRPGVAIMVVAGIDIVPDSAVNKAASAIAHVTTLTAPVPAAEIASQKVLRPACPGR